MEIKNINIFMGDDTKSERHGKIGNEQEGNRKTVFAGNLNKPEDPVVQKRAQARKLAAKIVGDAFAKEQEIDKQIAADKEKTKALTTEIHDRKEALADLKERAEKFNDPDMKRSAQNEEIEINKLEEERAGINASIRATRNARLKTHPIKDAENEADAVLQEANDEIMGILRKEAKDHVDEAAKEREEQAEKIAEKRAEEEERLEKKEKAEAKEEQLEKVQKNAAEEPVRKTNMEEAQKEVEEMMEKLKLLEEDLKGASVDTKL